MTPAGNLIGKLLDHVEAARIDQENFVAIGLSLLGLALSKLDPPEREELLAALESGGLRQTVNMYPGARDRAVADGLPWVN